MPAPELVDTFGRFSRQSAHQRHGSLQYTLFLLHAWDRGGVVPRAGCSALKRSSALRGIAARLGVKKLRVTGGRAAAADLPVLVKKLAAIDGIEDLAMTTNGVTLAAHAQALYDAGLRRVNIHLDTLDRERFSRSRAATIWTTLWKASTPACASATGPSR